MYLLLAWLLGALGYWTWTQVVELTPPPWAPDQAQPYQVVRVVDGDTIVARHRVSGLERRVRYLNVDAPELAGSAGPQVFAREALEANRRLVEGKTVWILPGQQDTDEHDRLLGYVFADGRFVNLDLVEQGYAQVMLVAPNLDYAQEFVAAQTAARQQGTGLWSTVEDVRYPHRLRQYDGRVVRLWGRVSELVPGAGARPLIVRLSVVEPERLSVTELQTAGQNPGAEEAPPEASPELPAETSGQEATGTSAGGTSTDSGSSARVTVLLFPELRPFFPQQLEEELRDQVVQVEGLLEFSGGRAQVVVREPGQLQLVTSHPRP